MAEVDRTDIVDMRNDGAEALWGFVPTGEGVP